MLKKLLTSTTIRLTPSAMVTTMVAATALFCLLSQLVHTRSDAPADGRTIMGNNDRLSLWKLNQRINLLISCPGPIERDTLCLPLSAMARTLDKRLNPTARVFVGGALGTNQPQNRTLYCFLQNYLFPRDVEISLDGKSYVSGVEFAGVPFQSLDELETNGFDVLVHLSANDDLDVIPLTSKAETQ